MNKFNYTFEDWLQDWFIKLRENGGIAITKDNCEDMFDAWLSNLETQELLDLGMLYGKEQYRNGYRKLTKQLRDIGK